MLTFAVTVCIIFIALRLFANAAITEHTNP